MWSPMCFGSTSGWPTVAATTSCFAVRSRYRLLTAACGIDSPTTTAPCPFSRHAGADPSAVMYLDGVYLARPAMAFVEFFDLERVEVLRGPQGTLYGRNAVGGALNLVTRPPSNTFEMSARATGGDFGALRAEGRGPPGATPVAGAPGAPGTGGVGDA